MGKNKSKTSKIGYLLKMCIVVLFFISLVFVTLACINYSIDNNLVNMIVDTGSENQYLALVIPSQYTEEAIKKEEEIIHPIDYLREVNAENIPAKIGQSIELNTKEMFLVKTRKSDKKIYSRVYKNNDANQVIEFNPTINLGKDNYKIQFEAPQEPGIYTYYMILRFNRYDAEYMFNLEVSE